MNSLTDNGWMRGLMNCLGHGIDKCRAIFLTLFFSLLASTAYPFCFEEAGAAYNVPPGLLWAIAKVESNFDPLAERLNADGSRDIGLMQINSSWFGRLPGVNLHTMRDPCANTRTGARILADCLERYGYTWQGIGCYNALSAEKRADYARRVIAVVRAMKQSGQE